MIPDGVIVSTDDSGSEGAVVEAGGEIPGCHRELGPIRLPLKNTADFILEFNEHYRAVGLELQQHTNEKIPSSHETAGDLNDASSSSATDHRT